MSMPGFLCLSNVCIRSLMLDNNVFWVSKRLFSSQILLPTIEEHQKNKNLFKSKKFFNRISWFVFELGFEGQLI